MNMEIFRLINNVANKNEILDKVMIFFSKDVPYIFILVVVITFIVGIMKKDIYSRKVAFSTFATTIINLLLSFIIGSTYYVDRPFVHNKVNILFSHVKDASFPSDHAAGTMSIALGLTKYNKLVSGILMALSIIVGFSRVYVGHHYPSDVIGAYIMVWVVTYIYNLKLRNIVENSYEIVERRIQTKLGFIGEAR